MPISKPGEVALASEGLATMPSLAALEAEPGPIPDGAKALVLGLGIFAFDATSGVWRIEIPTSGAETEDGPEPLLAAVEDLDEQVEAHGFALEAQSLRIEVLEAERTKPRRLSIASTSVGAGASVAFDLAWPGVQVGDATHATPFASLPAALAIRAFCPAVEVVRVQLFNPTGGSISTGAGDFTIAVIGRA